MSGILRLESLTKGNTLKQGDKTPLKYRLFDADGEKLNIAGKSAKVRLVYPDFLTIGYEKDGLTVAQDDTVTFTIDSVIPSRIYHVEIIVDDKFIFPSRADEAKFTVDKSSLGTETNIIEIVGVDQIVNTVLGKVNKGVSEAVTDINATNDAIQQAEQERVQAYQEIQQIIEDGALSAEPLDGSVTPEKTTFFKQERINLVDKTNITTPGIVLDTSGTIVTGGTTAPDYFATHYMPVEENTTYEFSFGELGKRASYAWYNDDNVEGYIGGGYNESTNRVHTSPTGAKYLRATFYLDTLDTAMVVKGALPSEYIGYNDTSLSFQTDTQRKSLSREVLKGIEPQLKGKIDERFVELDYFERVRFNLFDKSRITTPGIVLDTSGRISTAGIAPNYFATHYIPVEENTSYEFSYWPAGGGASFAWYNKESVDGYVSGGIHASTRRVHTSPVGAKYLRATFHLDILETAMVAEDKLPSEYVPFEEIKLSFSDPIHRKHISQEIYSEIEPEIKNLINNTEHRFSGLVWTTIGDSITEKNFRATKNYHDYVAEQLKLEVDNQGYSGTGYLQTYSQSLKIPDRLDLIDTNTDIITIMAGVNDRNKPLGEFGDTDKDTTLYGAIDYTLRTLIEKFPTKKIGVMTPLPTSVNYGEDGNSLHLIANAVIETARKYSLPVLDLYRESGLRPWNTTNNATYFSTSGVPAGDGLHPNAEGHLFISYKILEFVKTL